MVRFDVQAASKNEAWFKSGQKWLKNKSVKQTVELRPRTYVKQSLQNEM